jgi:tRNA 2-(methylsulfanyl)-N6-isopentenyladenosine37 hydroxylase
MLGLKMATDPRWVDIAAMNLEEILSDHAWCEQKAATFGISLISKFSGYTDIVLAVSPIVAEEWSHFRKVLRELGKRNLPLLPQRRDAYVVGLHNMEKKGGSKTQMLVEKLLICALIEARSCERFRLLSLHIQDKDLQKFYHDFMVSEAGHYRLFIDLAETYLPKDVVRKRWDELLEAEARLLETFQYQPGRIH